MKVDKFSTVYKHYNSFIVDVTGVVYDGIDPIIESIKTINYLLEQSCQVVFVSNSPANQEKLIEKIRLQGVNGAFEAISSGVLLEEDLVWHDICPIIADPCYIIGQNGRGTPVASMHIVDSILEAKYIYFQHFFEEGEDMDIFDGILEDALKLGLPAVCPNPDDIAVHGKKYRIPAGYLAKKYKALDGVVYYYGKPYQQIYNYVFEKYNINPKNALVIGDYLYTDILGANIMEMDSLLLLNGNHRAEKLHCVSVIEQGNIKPTYIMEELILK